MNAQMDNQHFINAGFIDITGAKASVGEIFIVQNFTQQERDFESNEEIKKEDNYLKILIYPNPTEYFLTIITDIKVLNVEIFDNLGNLIISEKNILNNQINVEKLYIGVYNIHIYLDKNINPSISTFIKL